MVLPIIHCPAYRSMRTLLSEIRAVRLIIMAAFSVGALALTELTVGAADLTPVELVNATNNAIRRIRNFRGHVTVLRPIQPVPEDAETDQDGLVVFQEFYRAWDPRHGREMAKGRELLVYNGQARYRRFWGAYDGEKLRTFGADTNGGQIVHSRGELSAYWHLDTLLGIGEIYLPKRDVSDVLDAKCEFDDDNRFGDGGILCLRTTFFENEGKPDAIEHILRIWVDTKHDNLPKRIEIVYVGSVDSTVKPNTLDKVINITRFERLGKGMWLPVEGQVTTYGLKGHYPEGMTPDGQFLGDPPEEKKRELLSKIKYKPVPLELTSTIRIAPESMKINEEIGPEIFGIEFPPTAHIFNEFEE